MRTRKIIKFKYTKLIPQKRTSLRQEILTIFGQFCD